MPPRCEGLTSLVNFAAAKTKNERDSGCGILGACKKTLPLLAEIEKACKTAKAKY